MKSNDQVKHLFANRQSGDSSNLHSDGTVLKSYSTPIAVWIEDVCFISSNGMSATTSSKHLSGLASAIRGHRFYTPAFQYHSYQAPSAHECITTAAEEMESLFNKTCRMRTHINESIERYEARRAEIMRLAERFSVTDLPAMPEATGDLKSRAKELAAKERIREAEALQRQEEKQRAQQIIDQGELDLWLRQGRGRYPYSFRKQGQDQITVKDDKVFTSQGAEAPLDHVIKALRFYDSRKYGQATPKTQFTPYHTNGHKVPLGNFTLDEIDEQGNVRAGCHTFTAKEIARFRKQWGM